MSSAAFALAVVLTARLLAQTDDYTAHFDRALELSLQNKDTEAIPEFRKTLELKPGLYEAEVNLAVLLLRNKQPAEAIPFLKDALNTKPKEIKLNIYYAQALSDTSDLPAAEAAWRAVLALDPQSQPAQQGLRNSQLAQAAAYEQAGKFNEAIAIYKQVPATPEIEKQIASLERTSRLARADSFKADHQIDKAIEQLQAAIDADPKNFDLRMDLGKTLRDQHKYLLAAQQFSAATQIRPADSKAWNELAAALVINKNFITGLEALDHARTLAPETAGQLYFRAISLDSLHQKKPAVEAYRKFLTLSTGQMPDQEFLARQRIRIIESEIKGK